MAVWRASEELLFIHVCLDGRVPKRRSVYHAYRSSFQDSCIARRWSKRVSVCVNGRSRGLIESFTYTRARTHLHLHIHTHTRTLSLSPSLLFFFFMSFSSNKFSSDKGGRGSRVTSLFLSQEYAINITFDPSIGRSSDDKNVAARRMRYRRHPVWLNSDISRFFILYVGMKLWIVLPGHWPSLSLSLLSVKWTFRNIICCAARSRTIVKDHALVASTSVRYFDKV